MPDAAATALGRGCQRAAARAAALRLCAPLLQLLLLFRNALPRWPTSPGAVRVAECCSCEVESDQSRALSRASISSRRCSPSGPDPVCVCVCVFYSAAETLRAFADSCITLADAPPRCEAARVYAGDRSPRSRTCPRACLGVLHALGPQTLPRVGPSLAVGLRDHRDRRDRRDSRDRRDRRDCRDRGDRRDRPLNAPAVFMHVTPVTLIAPVAAPIVERTCTARCVLSGV